MLAFTASQQHEVSCLQTEALFETVVGEDLAIIVSAQEVIRQQLECCSSGSSSKQPGITTALHTVLHCCTHTASNVQLWEPSGQTSMSSTAHYKLSAAGCQQHQRTPVHLLLSSGHS